MDILDTTPEQDIEVATDEVEALTGEMVANPRRTRI